MQCAGALSWSGVGWGAAMARSLSPNALNEKPRVQRESARAVSLAPPASRAARVEVSKLEQALPQDWNELVRRCMEGDSGAWAEMVRTHQKRVYGLCYRFTGNAADAEDLTQDVFLKIYSNLGSFDAARGSLPVWITTMTRNLLVDNFRRTRNQRATGSLDDGWEHGGGAEAGGPAGGRGAVAARGGSAQGTGQLWCSRRSSE